MVTGAQLQNWDTKLQLPVIGKSSLSAGITAPKGQSPVLLNAEQQEDYPIHSLMAAYKKKWANTAELACLHLLALFPYPVDKDMLLSTLSTLNVPPDIAEPKQKKSYSGAKGMLLNTLSNWNVPTEKSGSKDNNDSHGLYRILSYLLQDGRPDANKLTKALNKLAKAELLSIEEKAEGNIISILRPVNVYFAESLKTHFFDDWRLHQQQLVYYYDDLAESTHDEQRFWFNCKKRLHSLATTHKQQALDETYRPHIAPFLAKQEIGLAGYRLRLHLLTGFFQRQWDKTDFCLSAATKGYVQAEAGQALYQLGEQQEALKLLDNARLTLVKAESWTAADEIAHLMGQHASAQQDISEGIRRFQQCIDYAEKGQNTSILLKRMRSLFQLYKSHGDIEAAGLVADKAKSLLSQLQQKNTKPSAAIA